MFIGESKMSPYLLAKESKMSPYPLAKESKMSPDLLVKEIRCLIFHWRKKVTFLLIHRQHIEWCILIYWQKKVYVSDVKTEYTFNVFSDSNYKRHSASTDMLYIRINPYLIIIIIIMQKNITQTANISFLQFSKQT